MTSEIQRESTNKLCKFPAAIALKSSEIKACAAVAHQNFVASFWPLSMRIWALTGYWLE